MRALGHLFILFPMLLAADGATKPGCSADGRYFMHHDRGEKIYCFDGESYPEGDLPKHVKEFFEPPPPPKKAPGGSSGSDGPSPMGTDSPKPSITRKAGAGSGGAAGKDQAGIDWDMGKKMAKSGEAAAGVSAATASAPTEPSALDVNRLNQIQIGMERKVVIAKLGKPHGAVMNVSGDGIVQILSYVTTEGTASVHLLEGRVVTIRRPRPD